MIILVQAFRVGNDLRQEKVWFVVESLRLNRASAPRDFEGHCDHQQHVLSVGSSSKSTTPANDQANKPIEILQVHFHP